MKELIIVLQVLGLSLAPTVGFLLLMKGLDVIKDDALIGTLNNKSEGKPYSMVSFSDALSSWRDSKTGELQFPSAGNNTQSSSDNTEWKYL